MNSAKMHILKNSTFLIAYIYQDKLTDEWFISINRPKVKEFPKRKYKEFRVVSLEDVKDISEAS
jgi:hypothetical protein